MILGIGIVALLIFSFPPVSNKLIVSLESRYTPISAESLSNSQIQWIVVLGGGHNSSLPAGMQLSPSSLARVTEGIRIYRTKAGRKIILSGGAVFDPLPNAKAMQSTARIFGVSEQDIILETESWDTEDEARLIAPIVKKEPFYLVTSAVHMPRSMALFQKQGTNPVPAPTDFAFRSVQSPLGLRLMPNTSALSQSERSLREYLGMMWSRIRGRA